MVDAKVEVATPEVEAVVVGSYIDHYSSVLCANESVGYGGGQHYSGGGQSYGGGGRSGGYDQQQQGGGGGGAQGGW